MSQKSIRRPKRWSFAAAGAVVAVVLAACGSSPTDSSNGGGTGTQGGSSGSSSLDAVYSAVKGLTGQARYNKLLALAKKEGGQIGFYHSGDMTDEVAAFEKQTGLKVADYQSTSERVAERVNDENKAGRQGSDVVMGGSADMVALRDEGGIAPLQSPVTGYNKPDFESKDLVDPIAIMMLPTFNSNGMSSSDVPKNWTDFFQHFAKRKAVELTDWEWMATLVKKYFEPQGMSESDAIALITNGLKGATAVDGHTLVAQLLASGQYDFVPNLYAHYIPGLVKDGAPLSNDGVSKQLPPMLITLFIGLTAGAPHPAGGLLLLEWMMSKEGQQVVYNQGYIPPSSTFTGQTLWTKYPYALVSTEWQASQADQQKWQKAWDNVMKGAGQTEHGS